MRRCNGCLYHGVQTNSCDYLLITKERRGCSVDDCTRYLPSSTARRLVRYYAGLEDLPEKDRKLLELYERGMNDGQIAEASGFHRKVVHHWRMKMGLPSQKELSEEEDET